MPGPEIGQLSQYFWRKEFACQCGCGFDTVDWELMHVLNSVRWHFQKPMLITSGCRCTIHNYKVGGSDLSQHTRGKAADIKIKGIKPQVIYDYLCHNYSDRFGIGLYNSWVHIDVRDDGPKRWVKRGK